MQENKYILLIGLGDQEIKNGYNSFILYSVEHEKLITENVKPLLEIELLGGILEYIDSGKTKKYSFNLTPMKKREMEGIFSKVFASSPISENKPSLN